MGSIDKKKIVFVLAYILLIAIFVYVIWYVFHWGIIGLLIGVFLLAVLGIVIGIPLTDFIGQKLSNLFFHTGEIIIKPKDYSKPRSLTIQNRLEEAIEEYQKILQEDETDITVYSELGEIYYERLKDYSAAFNCYDKMEKYAKETSDIIFAINRKADIYLHDQNYAQAIKELEKITKKFPKTKDASRAQERIQNLKKYLPEANQ